MPKIHFEKIIKAERNKVFDIATNYEEFQKKIPEYFTSIRIRSVRDNVAVIEEHIKLAGKELVMMTKHVTKYPETHEIFVIGGDAKGSHILEHYQSVTEGTKISVDADIKLKGVLKIVGFFGKRKIASGFIMMMDEFAKIAES
ncbi:MAG TPA: SRPBCC family protein [Nitrosopumilaceae archaeon]|nr:SRPBCC family protein [Nitrosopumilaceae archaeon]